MAGDPTAVLIDAAKAHIRANITGMASLYEGEIESHVPDLIHALQTALTAHDLEIRAKKARGKI